jgi:three-Cys-motif partner protein
MMGEDRWRELCDRVRGDDGLPVWEVGAWTQEKLYFWHRYLDITTTALVGSPGWRGGLIYCDLFAGAGVCALKDSGDRIPGSVLIAANTNRPFARIIACERTAALADACRSRLAATCVANRCHVLEGDCNERIGDTVRLIPDKSLTLAFIDPKGLDANFATIATLTQGRSVDLVVLFADAYDIPRNLELHYRKDQNSKLDQVLGPNSGWRERLDRLPNPAPTHKRRLFREIYKDQLRNHLGYTHFRQKVIRYSRGPIYTLLYASRHPLGLEFWDAALGKDVHGQRWLFD